jgi:hypothetical protein
MVEQSNSVDRISRHPPSLLSDTPQTVRALLQFAPLFRVSDLGLILAALLSSPERRVPGGKLVSRGGARILRIMDVYILTQSVTSCLISWLSCVVNRNRAVLEK